MKKQSKDSKGSMSKNNITPGGLYQAFLDQNQQEFASIYKEFCRMSKGNQELFTQFYTQYLSTTNILQDEDNRRKWRGTYCLVWYQLLSKFVENTQITDKEIAEIILTILKENMSVYEERDEDRFLVLRICMDILLCKEDEYGLKYPAIIYDLLEQIHRNGEDYYGDEACVYILDTAQERLYEEGVTYEDIQDYMQTIQQGSYRYDFLQLLVENWSHERDLEENNCKIVHNKRVFKQSRKKELYKKIFLSVLFVTLLLLAFSIGFFCGKGIKNKEKRRTAYMNDEISRLSQENESLNQKIQDQKMDEISQELKSKQQRDEKNQSGELVVGCELSDDNKNDENSETDDIDDNIDNNSTDNQGEDSADRENSKGLGYFHLKETYKLREAADKSSDVIKILEKDTYLELLEDKGAWQKVKIDNLVGYVMCGPIPQGELSQKE